VQYEKWNYPVLDPEKKSNWVTSAGFTFAEESVKSN